MKEKLFSEITPDSPLRVYIDSAAEHHHIHPCIIFGALRWSRPTPEEIEATLLEFNNSGHRRGLRKRIHEIQYMRVLFAVEMLKGETK